MATFKCHCPNCEQHLEAPLEAAGSPVVCPTCQTRFNLPSAADAADLAGASAAPPGPLCAFCQSGIQSSEPRATCPACQAEYHAECWEENGGCAVYGCAHLPQTEPRRDTEIPASYWGQEDKPCPACGKQILAAAVRCRHCGATFESARPEEAGEFQQRRAFQKRLPVMKRTVLWIFVFSVVPCLAPIGAVWGSIWYAFNRQHVRALPSIFPALCAIALVVGIGQCLLLLLMSALYAATQVP